MTTYARSDVGLVRTNNEDCYFVDPRRGLAVVADGMGGHAAGEIASKITVDTISAQVVPTSSLWPFGRAQRERDRILASIRSANTAVREAATKDSGLRGMGTTVVVLWVRGRQAHVAHVGDSRLYRFRRDALVQLTRDHSWPSEDGSMRNVLTRAVGAETDVEIDYRLIETEPGDVFLLCSDGLTRTVEDPVIIRTLREAKNGDEASERLIELARQSGAPDNVTVVLTYC